MKTQNGYYLHPTLHGDTIVFVCEDDLWCVSTDGGSARRLTAHSGTALFPRFSPDGSRIAFSAKEEGPLEVYIMEAQGGPPSRLTWLGGATCPAGWAPDGRSLFLSTDHQSAMRGELRLYSVPVEGGHPRPLELGPARLLSIEPGGKGRVLSRGQFDPARWKRYRGGTAGALWIDRAGDGRFRPLIRLDGNLANPMWLNGRIFFLSDHEGHGNIYSCTPTGRGLLRHTHHEGFYARHPSAHDGRIVYHAGADLYLLDTKTNESRKIEVRLASPRAQRARKFVPAARHLEGFELHPKGHSIATVNRGGLFSMGLWEGAPARHGEKSSARYRLGVWLADGKRIAAVTDEGGEESLIIFPVGEPGKPRSKQRIKRIKGEDLGRPLEMVPAPAGGDWLALSNHRHEVHLVNLGTGKSKLVERSKHAPVHGLVWSPDGRWLAYGFSDSNRTSSIHLYRVSTGKVTPVTRSEFSDGQPSFDPSGRYLYFLSARVYDPVYDSIFFDLGFPKGMKPYLIPLKKDTPSPFEPGMRRPRAPGASATDDSSKEDAAKKVKKGKKADEPEPVEIDLDGIEDRVIGFPVAEGLYKQILGAPDRVLFTSVQPEGSLGMSWTSTEPEAKALLQAYILDERKTETVAEGVSTISLSADAKVLGIRCGNRIRVVPASFKSDGQAPKDEPGRESGWIDMGRIRLEVIPEREWRQMFREAWRLQRDHFWNAEMSGVDWQEVHDRYLTLLDRVTARSEFSDLMWEMQGELGTSHCYELGGDYRPVSNWHQGFLGADLEQDAKTGSWRVGRVPVGDSWSTEAASPLSAPGVNVVAGDEILEVDGRPVGKDVSPHQLLLNSAGRDIELTVRSKGKGSRPAAPRTVIIKTLVQEKSLRYRDWVESNRAWVHRRSRGRVGYVHIPDMGPHGYSEFHRYFLQEVNYPGLIIDVRYNGGGHVSQLILSKLMRKRIGYDLNRWGTPFSYPLDAPMGPMVALTNEYAGSDGDIFSHSFKVFGLGPLIGTRTWGGVIGIWPRHSLVDGTITTQPEFASWFADVEYAVENYGTDPDIEVLFRPQDYASGKDPQLERGLSEIEKLIRKIRPRIPSMKKGPSRRPPKLPRS